MCSACNSLIAAIDGYIEKADRSLEKKLKAAGFLLPRKTLQAASKLEDSITEVLKDETKLFTKRLKKAVDIQTFFDDIWEEVKEIDDVDVKLGTVFVDSFNEIMPSIAAAYIKNTDPVLRFIKVTDRTAYHVAENSKTVAQKMKLSSHENLEKILHNGIEEGKSVQQVAKEIFDGGIRDERYRARSVALTEMLRVHAYVSDEATMQSSAVEQKEWVHTGNEKNQPRPNHIAMNGALVDKNEPFELVGADGNTYYPMFPLDFCLPASESVNCHCISRPVVSEAALGIAPDERRRMQREYIENDDREWEKELDMINFQRAKEYRAEHGKG